MKDALLSIEPSSEPSFRARALGFSFGAFVAVVDVMSVAGEVSIQTN